MKLKTFLKKYQDENFYDLTNSGHAILYPVKYIEIKTRRGLLIAKTNRNDKTYFGELIYKGEDTEFKEWIKRIQEETTRKNTLLIGFLKTYFPVERQSGEPTYINEDQLYLLVDYYYNNFEIPIFNPKFIKLYTMKDEVVTDKFTNIEDITKFLNSNNLNY